ncbi:NirD/YgiW/YdeI family stress tolerance protein [Shewanella oneidensis]|uniref:Plasmid-encoded periplasmic BOF domain protein YgiW n=1 Tax=Shewanella oneidensis (strain ATCC 700550 / JCM 31522 / CIP 106686 / LMG 19005 / NCIMB 14063 / MR-1) TaxID=211586 RepID=Q8E827_SHEON|nr:NirD/YgiW/YdeI family stress tolerance protein [Shewanella oneidensis]AAN53045.1 plasmid-encoded periplasmic BOF domain protein YgiW [Shewanella oneidensis MR-1]MDX5999826.1 NirD/YgiW/YdeI family stress tolerance protein [Shewanella oneidensis]MEE2030286.1 Protein YgiW [Shewanella oneidensis]
MYKFIITIFVMALSSTAMADQAGFQFTTGEPKTQGGFQGPNVKQVIRSVVSANNASDDDKVELTGYIVSSIGDDDYIFRDATGDIKANIDDDLWHGYTVTPDTKVIIRGEVDKDWSKVTVDVENIQIIQ